MTKKELVEDKTLEKEFIEWAEARDDDWWRLVSIWDYRIMLDFFKPKMLAMYEKGREEGELKKGQTKREWYQKGYKDGLNKPISE